MLIRFLACMAVSLSAFVAIAATSARHRASPPCEQSASLKPRTPVQQAPGWSTQSTTNFLVYCAAGQDVGAIAQKCEALRSELAEKWLGQTPESTWRGRCIVVFHADARSYVQALGKAAEQTSGCSTIQEDKGRIVSRRIDLRADRPEPLDSVLPHELLHVLLADRFAGKGLPRWVDEGLAVQADSLRKREGHERDLHEALSRRSVLRIPMLFSDEQTQVADPALFYAQSASLVRFLVGRTKPAKFLDFVEASGTLGYDAALREHFGIRNVAELERAWLQSHRQRHAPAVLVSSISELD